MEIPFTLSGNGSGLRIGRALFLGPSGSGKTYFAGHFVRELGWPKQLTRVVAPPTKPSLAKLVGVKHIGVSITDRTAQERVFGEIFKQVTTPIDEGGTDIGLALDDSDFYFSEAGRTYGTSSLSQLVKLGREAGLSQVFVAQGSAAVSKDLISNSNLVGFFRTSEPNLLDYARRYMRDIPEVEHVLSSLAPYTCLLYSPNGDPKVLGVAKVVNGRIETKEPTWSENPEASTSEEEDSEAETSANTPDAPSPSPTGSGGASAPSTTPSTSGNSTD